MSFAAMSTWQALALISVASALAAGLFLMKVRPPRVRVPTLLLWQRVFDQTRELTWWERVRRAVSIAATVVLAALLALAVTRPGPRRGPASSGRTLIVLDSSWSMAAYTSSGETRWQRAVRHARALANAAAAAGDVALATTADGLVEGPTPDLALIETAIDRLGPAGGDRSVWPRVAGTDNVHFITDGAVARALGPDVTVHSVFEPASNAAIISFGARPAVSADGGAEAFLQLANYGDAARNVRVIVSRGTAVVSDQRVDLAAGESVSQVLPLRGGGSARLLAHIESDHDALAEDNDAVAWIDGTEPVDVLLVSEQPSALQPLLALDPSLRVTLVKPSEFRAPASGIVIFDRWAPAEPPVRPSLLVAPPAITWLGTAGPEERLARWKAGVQHPVVMGVDPDTLNVKRARAIIGDSAQPVATSDTGTPLVSVIDTPRQRAVVWSFAVADANAASAPGFPVLFGNSIEWLARPSYGVLRAPGAVRLPASTTRVVSPTGDALPVVRAGETSVVRASAPGLYLVDAAGSRGVIGVNVGDPDVSNLSRSTLAEGAATRVAAGGAGWPWWMWAVVFAFILSTAEWWTWQRRITV